jgi:hypothetical protein
LTRIPIGILMFYLEVVKNLSARLSDHALTHSFMEAVEFRHRLFRTNRKNVCLLDPYDLVSDHVILRSSATDAVMAYVRATSASGCAAHGLDYPIEAAAKTEPAYLEAYARFKAAGREAMHMNLLCLDPSFREELRGIKIVDFMIWLGFQESGLPREKLCFTATPNAKYHQDPWLKKIGTWVADLPDFIHPTIPEPHRFILIPELSELYWRAQSNAYGELYKSLKAGRTSAQAA